METRVEEIRQQLAGKTEMSPALEQDLFERIAEVEGEGVLVASMGKVDLALGIVLAALTGIMPVILVGMGVL